MPHKFDVLKKIYSKIPAVDCKGHCAEACANVPALPVENKYLEHIGIEPFDDETVVIKKLTESGKSEACKHLKDGKCSIYDNRPIICRLYGTTTTLKCSWGCVPKKYLPNQNAQALIRRLRKYDFT